MTKFFLKKLVWCLNELVCHELNATCIGWSQELDTGLKLNITYFNNNKQCLGCLRYILNCNRCKTGSMKIIYIYIILIIHHIASKQNVFIPWPNNMYFAKLWILLSTFNNYYIYNISDFQCHKSLFIHFLSVVTAVPRCTHSIDHGVTINKNCHQCKTGKLSLLVR